MVTRVIVFGTGGTCIDIVDTIDDINAQAGRAVFECVGYLDDDPTRLGCEYLGRRVLGPLEHAVRYPDCSFVNGIGSPQTFGRKAAIIARAGVSLERFVSIVHPTAHVSRSATIGRGTVLFQHVVITSGVRLGNHIVILPNSVVSHDSRVGDYCCLSGGVCISGNVNIGDTCYIGTNCAVINGATIGGGSLLGMGAVVLGDVAAGSVMVGNPARLLRRTAGAAGAAAGAVTPAEGEGR